MMGDVKKDQTSRHLLLTPEQEEVLDLYIQRLDSFFEELKAAEKLQVEIETQHLKKILSK